MSRSVFVTGVTGHVGGATLRHLDKSRFSSIKVGVTSAEKGKKFKEEGFEPVVINYDQKDTLLAAFKGVDCVVIIPTNCQNRGEQGQQAIAAAKEAGVKHVILFSVPQASEKRILFHKQFYPMEEDLQHSGMDYTILQGVWFQENALGFKDGVYLPFRDGFSPFVSVHDLGRCIASVAANPDPHKNKTYMLTGPQAATGQDIAKALSEVHGKEIKYVDVPPSEAKKTFLSYGMQEWQVNGVLELLEEYASKRVPVTDHVKQITGSPARFFLETAKAAMSQQ